MSEERRNEAHERAIVEAPDDERVRLAYADWLQQQGNPRGELAMVQYLLAQKKLPVAKRSHPAPIGARAELEKRERELFDKHEALALESEAELTWRVGFVEAASFELQYVSELEEELQTLFAHPSARLLRTLSFQTDYDDALDDAVDLLTQLEVPPSVRSFVLHVGELQWPDPDFPPEGDWPTVSRLPELFEAFPRMEALRVRGGLPNRLAFPKSLRSLAVETTELRPSHLESLLRTPRPALTSFELWFGKSLVGVAELDPLLAGKVGSLERLGLMNTELSDALVPVLARSPLLKRLEWLSLAFGTLTDSGGAAILDAASWFDDVKTLDVSENFLSDDLLEQLSTVCPRLVAGEQRDEDWGVEPAYFVR